MFRCYCMISFVFVCASGDARREGFLGPLARAPPGAEEARAECVPRLRCSALPVADEAEHKHVQWSIADADDLSSRKISGTTNGRPSTQPLVVKERSGTANGG